MAYRIKHFLLSILFLSALLLMGSTPENNDMVSLTLADESELTIIGSSTLHGWDSDATEFSVYFRVGEEWLTDIENWRGDRVDTLGVIVPINKLESGRSRMNRDMREALNAEDHPEIKFTWDDIQVGEATDSEGKELLVRGSLNISGETRSIEFEALGDLPAKNRISVEGSYNLNMRDYNIDPPTAFFGTLRTDERVEIRFSLVFERE